MRLDEALEKDFKIWFVDGSSYYEKGRAKTGYGIIRVNDGLERGGPVIPHSAQAAEVAAVKELFATQKNEVNVAIFTDSD